MQLASTAAHFRLRQFLSLTKPRVVSLIVFCAVIGMFLAVPGMVRPKLLLAATIGIWLVAGAAAAVNCLVEQKIDAVMTRTRARPLPRGELTSLQTLAFAGAVGGTGLWMLYALVNPLTMWLTFGTFIGYAVVYTVLLKPMTPQNIVIGGASGAMPPVLGWAAVTGDLAPEALLLFLIIFAWTPPHFWALALYRTEDFAKAGLPMLPVTHGHRFTRLYVLLYTLILFASALLPFAYGMSGWIYLAAAVVLNGAFLGYAVRLYVSYSDALARRTSPRCSSIISRERLPADAVRARLRRVRARRLRRVGPLLQEHGYHGRRLRQGFCAHRPYGQDAHACRFSRQGGGDVLRLHPLPRRMSDDACGAEGRERAARRGREAAAGSFRHGRPGARHAKTPRELRSRVRPRLSR